MPAPIKVSFQISGDRELLRVFSTIEQRVQRLANVEAKAARASQASATKRARATKAAADKGTAATTAALSKQVSAEEAHARRIVRIKERSAIMSGRIKAKEAAAEIAMAKRVEAATHKSRMRVGMGAASAFGRAGRSTIGSVGGLAGGLGATAGSMMIGSALSEAVRLRDQAAQIVNASRATSGPMKGQRTQSVGELTGFAQNISTQYGVNAVDVMTGLGTVTERAGGGVGLEKAKKDWGELTKIADAYGASQEDLGAVVAASLNAGIKPGEEMRDLVSSLIAMGKEGQIEFRNLGPELPKLVGAMMTTELEGAAGIREMVALAQLAVSTTVSPEEARTSVARSISDMEMKAPILRKAGVKAFGETGKTRATHDLIPDILAAAEQDPSKFGKGVKSPVEALNKIFGVRAKKMTSGLAETFRLAGGGEKGKVAVRKAITDKAAATLGAGEIESAHATRMATEAKQMAVAMAKFKVEIAKMLPEFARMLPKLLAVTQGFAQLAVWVTKNPFEGLGIVFAAKLTSELTAAALPSLFKTAMESASTATFGGVGAGGTGKGGKAMRGLGAGLVITATAVTLITQGVKMIDKASAEGAKEGKDVFRASMETHALLLKGKRGELSEAETAKLKKHGETLSQFGQRSVFGAAGEVAGGVKATDALNQLALLDKTMQFFRESAKGSEGVTAEGAKEQSEQIAAMLAKAAKASEQIAANLKAGADNSRDGKPPSR